MFKFQFSKIILSLCIITVIFIGGDMAQANQESCDTIYGFSAAYSGASCIRKVNRGGNENISNWYYYQPTTSSRELNLILEKEMDTNIQTSLKDERIKDYNMDIQTILYDQLWYHREENTGSIVHASMNLQTSYKDQNIESIEEKYSYNYDTIHKKLIRVDELLSKNEIQKVTDNLKKEGRCSLLTQDITKYSFIKADSTGKIQSLVLYPCTYRDFSITVDYSSLMPLPDKDGCRIMKGLRHFDYSQAKKLRDVIICQKPLNTGISKLDKAIDIKEKRLIKESLQNDYGMTYNFDHEIVHTGKITSILLTITRNRGSNSGRRYITFNYNKNTGKFVTLSQLLTKKQITTAIKQIIKFSRARSSSWSGDGKYDPYGEQLCTQSQYAELFSVNTDSKGKINAIIFYNHCLTEMLPIKLSYPSFEVMDIDDLNKIPVFRHFFYGEKL